MYLKNIKFNHDVENLQDSIGLSSIGATICRERIFFTAFCNHFQAVELYGEDTDNHPRQFRTVTGDLERCLILVNDELEHDYTLLTFRHAHDLALRAVGAYVQKQKENELSNEKKAQRKIHELIETIMDLRKEESNGDDDEEDDKPIDKLSKDTLIKRVSMAKKANYNFSTYISILGKYFNDTDVAPPKAIPEVNDLLNNLFSKDED